jgi:hypothetical protein
MLADHSMELLVQIIKNRKQLIPIGLVRVVVHIRLLMVFFDPILHSIFFSFFRHCFSVEIIPF